jgi:putative exosortase-associated protein (TIGR04073 family)
VAKAPGNQPIFDRAQAGSGWAPVLRFLLATLCVSAVITLIALPVLDHSWWKIVRRSASIAAGLSLWLCVVKLERRPLSSYGFASWEAGKRDLRFGIVLGAAALGVMFAAGLATGVCRIAITPDEAKLWRTLLGFLPAAGLVAVLEELVFRGYVLQHLLRWSRAGAVGLTSALYAAVHLKSPEWTTLTTLELGGLFLLGVVLALSYLRTGQLFLAVGLHAVLAYGARVNKLMIGFNDVSIAWLSGTSRLVNGACGWLVLLALGAIIWWWTRKRGVAAMARLRASMAAGGVILMLAAGTASASGIASVDETKGGPSHMTGALRKLGRGIANVVTCPVELPRTVEKVALRDGWVAGTTVGGLQGAARMVLRAGAGVFEVLTFPVEATPGNPPLIKPEFVFGNDSWELD